MRSIVVAHSVPGADGRAAPARCGTVVPGTSGTSGPSVSPVPSDDRRRSAVPDRSAEEFDAFYRRSARRLVGHVYLATGDLEASEDAVAEAFARAWARWSVVRRADSPEAWVRTVASRLAISNWRKLRNRLTAHRREADGTRDDGVLLLGPDRVALVAALRELPARQRQAIVLHHLADLSVAAVADEMDVPAGTVKAWLSRGRTSLRHLLEDAPTTDRGVS